MNSSRSGKNVPSPNIRSVRSIVTKNCKLELVILAAGIVWLYNSWRFPAVQELLYNYFSESRCSGISGYASVVIGIYVTVWSIFATSASKINAEILKKKVEGQLFFLIALGLVESFATTVFCVFVPSTIVAYTEFLLLTVSLSFVSFIKFIIITIYCCITH